MDIQVQQGLNLESDVTTIKINIGDNHEELKKLLDLIKSFHPIFISEYKIEGNILTIRSKLPTLWKNSTDSLTKLSKKDTTYEKAKEYILDTVIAKRIKSMSTIPLLHSAHKLGYETTLTILDQDIVDNYEKGYSSKWNRYYTVGCGKGSQTVASISSSKDSIVGQSIQKDKWTTNQMIERLGLPIAKWNTLDSKEEIQKVWDEYEKPVVIKPTGLVGGKGVSVGINTVEEAEKAYEFAKNMTDAKIRQSWQTKIMIQEQIQGDKDGSDYRLLVINGKLRIATKRIPAFVTGNGNSTIEELINETNSDPRRDISNPAHILKPIEIDEPLINFLDSQKLSLDSIPEKDKRIYVRNISSMSRGGMTEDYTEKVSKEIKYIVETIAQSIHAFALGVDIMCKDISKPLTEDNGGILEVNTMPEAYLNFYPTLGESREYIAEEYIKELLEDCNTKKFVCIGYDIDDLATNLRKKNIIKEDDVTGEYKNGNIFINSLVINTDVPRWKATEALKVNASLNNIILHYRGWDEIKEFGLGFDKIDYLYITKEYASNKEYIKTIKRYKRKGYIKNIKRI